MFFWCVQEIQQTRNDLSRENSKNIYQLKHKEFDKEMKNLVNKQASEHNFDFLICVKNLEKQIKMYQQEITVVNCTVL